MLAGALTSPLERRDFSIAGLQALPGWPLGSAQRARKLNIGLLIPTLQAGGAQRACSLLSNHWARSGHHITLMTFSDPSSDAFTVSPFVNRVILGEADETVGVWRKAAKNSGRLHAVRSQLVACDLDVALSFMSVTNTLLAIAGRGLPAVCIGAERADIASTPLPTLAGWARSGLWGWLDAVVGHTDDSARWLKHNTRARSVAVIPDPVELPLPSSKPFLDPRLLRRPASRLLLAVGRLSTEKNHDQLIRAFVRVSETLTSPGVQKPWQLVIVGEGPQRSVLEALIKQLGAQDRVLLPGWAGNLADWYSSADAFALTSTSQGCPNSLLEALAYGVPSVVCDCLIGLRELIRDGVNALLVPPHSAADLEAALRRLMTDPKLRERLAQQAKKTTQAHGIEGISQRWEAVFEKAMASRGFA